MIRRIYIAPYLDCTELSCGRDILAASEEFGDTGYAGGQMDVTQLGDL